MRLAPILFLLLASLAWANSCEADVKNAFVNITVKEFIGPGVYEGHSSELELYDYVKTLNYTRIYLSGLDSSAMCSTSCGTEFPSDFIANFVVVTESGGSFKPVEVFGLEDG